MWETSSILYIRGRWKLVLLRRRPAEIYLWPWRCKTHGETETGAAITGNATMLFIGLLMRSIVATEQKLCHIVFCFTGPAMSVLFQHKHSDVSFVSVEAGQTWDTTLVDQNASIPSSSLCCIVCREREQGMLGLYESLQAGIAVIVRNMQVKQQPKMSYQEA